MSRWFHLTIFLIGFAILIASDFTAHTPWYYSVPLGYCLGSLGAAAVLGARRR